MHAGAQRADAIDAALRRPRAAVALTRHAATHSAAIYASEPWRCCGRCSSSAP